MNTMKAAVFEGPKTIKIMNMPLPAPAENQLRIKMEGCGICGSNFPVWEGREWFKYPIDAGSPGHEGWGIVDEVGKNVTKFKKGDRVAALTYNAFAEYDIAKADAVRKIPLEINGTPFPAEPLGCAMNIFNRSDIHPEHFVAIIGIGFLGALLVELVKSTGAMVIAISKREFSLLTAKQYGADFTIPLQDHWGIVNNVKDITGGEMCDRVIEAVGLQWPLDLAGDLVKERGKLIIAGYHQDGIRQVNMQNWNWKGIDVINAHEREQKVYMNGISEAITAVQKGMLNPGKLYTHNFYIDDLNEAFEVLSKRPDGFMKALVRF